jgi:hypothetical protein
MNHKINKHRDAPDITPNVPFLVSPTSVIMFTTIEDVAEKHSGLICHLTKLLDLFIAMRYVSPSDVIRPPHAPGIIASPLGLEPDVLVLTTLIPWMRTQIVEGYQWFGVELIPRSKAVT